MKKLTLNFSKKFLKNIVRQVDYQYQLRKDVRKKFCQLSAIDTVKHVRENGCSLVRFGDGELSLMCGRDIRFQHFDPILKDKLVAIAANVNQDFLVCIPSVFDSLDFMTTEARKFWLKNLYESRKHWYSFFEINAVYGDTLASRPYIDHKDKTTACGVFQEFKKIWAGRDVLVVEGEQTCFGVGNDLLTGCRSISRVIAPPLDAFDCYEKIFESALCFGRDRLVLIALGPTSKPLIAQLSGENIQAIDVGHLDIEYEWMQAGAKRKQAVPGKWVNEADQKYVNSEKIRQNRDIQVIIKITKEK